MVHQSARFRASRLTEEDETVLVEFLGNGSRTITPPGSGMTYRFGQDEQHRLRRVRRVDAPRILANAQFRAVEEPVAPAVDPGEPIAERTVVRRGRGRAATAEKLDEALGVTTTDEAEASGESEAETEDEAESES